MAKDDDDKPIKSNAAPEPRPPGVGRSDHAPPGSVGTGKPWVEGPFYLGGHGENPFTRGNNKHGSEDDGVPPPDRTTPRFHETDDPEVNRMYGRDHIMVRKDGSEMRPHEWEKEQPLDDGPGDRPISDGHDVEHPHETAPGHDDGIRLDPSDDDSIRPQLWEDQNKRDDDDGIDR